MHTQRGELGEMTPCRRTGIELSLVSTQLVSLVPSPEVAHISIVPRAFRYAFGVISLKPMAERGEVGEKKNRKKPWHCCFFHFTSCSWWRAHLARSRDSRRALDKNDLNVSSSLQTCLVAFCLQSTSNLAWLLRPAPEHSENQRHEICSE